MCNSHFASTIEQLAGQPASQSISYYKPLPTYYSLIIRATFKIMGWGRPEKTAAAAQHDGSQPLFISIFFFCAHSLSANYRKKWQTQLNSAQ